MSTRLVTLAVLVVAVLAALVVFGCRRQAKEAETPQAPAEQATAEAPPAAPAKNVLVSKLAGTWYPAGKPELEATIDRLLDGAEGGSNPDVCALILPHAGYRYSGDVAASGLRQVRGRTFKRVVVLGPSHRPAMANRASVPDATHYRTPLGEVPLDTETIAALKKDPHFVTEPAGHDEEHSVQIEVPLLQRAIGEFLLVPIVVGQLDLSAAEAMATVLRGLIDADTLVVASSDFTHYGARFGYVPFKTDLPENLRKLDLGAYAPIEGKDAGGFLGYVAETGATICGRCPIAVLLSMLPDDAAAHLVKYDTSGRITGDWANSVSYLAAAFTGKWPARETAGAVDPLSAADKKALLALARQTLTYYLDNRETPRPAQLGIEVSPGMETVMGAFVTLKKHGALRGCIGEIVPRRSLYSAVIDQAVNAGTQDYRFSPVKPAELGEIEFEVSALTAPHPVESYRDIVLGRDGIILQRGGRQAVFLPQVAPEQGWGLEETLMHLSMKAGLPPDGWKDARFSVFEAIVFSEGGA